MTADKHDHPAHYGGKDNPYEAIVVIEAWGASFCGGNALKYICRAGKKPGETALDDLKKAKWYLERAVDHATALVDGAPTDKTSDHTASRVVEAWALPKALAACVTAIGYNSGPLALRYLNNHIIALLETKKEIPRPVTDVKLNAVKCLKCNTVAVSTRRHHMQDCECGHVFVDGGHDYKRRGWSGERNFIELNELPVDATRIRGLEKKQP